MGRHAIQKMVTIMGLILVSANAFAYQCWDENQRKEAEFQHAKLGEAQGKLAANKAKSNPLEKILDESVNELPKVQKSYIQHQTLRFTIQNIATGTAKLGEILAHREGFAQEVTSFSVNTPMVSATASPERDEEQRVLDNVVDAVNTLTKDDVAMIGDVPGAFLTAFSRRSASDMRIALDGIREQLFQAQAQLSPILTGESKRIADLNDVIASTRTAVAPLVTEREQLQNEIKDRYAKYKYASDHTPVYCPRELPREAY